MFSKCLINTLCIHAQLRRYIFNAKYSLFLYFMSPIIPYPGINPSQKPLRESAMDAIARLCSAHRYLPVP